MRPLLLVSLLLALGGAAVAAPTTATGMTELQKDKLQKEIARYATPDEHHKALQPLVGSWNTRAKLWLGGPKPEQVTGHAEVKSILGGRFVEEHYDTVILGKPFAGQGVLGYDTRAKKYVATWIDTWGTWITVEAGGADATLKKLTLTAEDYDVATGKTRPLKFVYDLDGNDHHVMRVYETIEGKETLTMEIDYRRK